MPTLSIGRRTVSVSTSRSRVQAKKTHSIAIGTLSRKIQCHVKLSLIQPPMIGPMAGPSRVVIAQTPIAAPRLSGGKTRSMRVWDIGMTGAPQIPCPMRQATSMPRVTDIPHSSENSPKPIIARMNMRTTPNRAASQPVNGTQTASATA
jgi:hypothetical protein